MTEREDITCEVMIPVDACGNIHVTDKTIHVNSIHNNTLTNVQEAGDGLRE